MIEAGQFENNFQKGIEPGLIKPEEEYSTPEALEELVHRRIQEMNLADRELTQEGREGMERIAGGKEEAQIDSEAGIKTKYQGKLNEWLEKVAASGRKKILIMALATTIFANMGVGIKKAAAEETEVFPQKIEQLSDKLLGNEFNDKDQEALEKFTKEFNELRAEKIRQELIKHVASDEYLAKLAKENSWAEDAKALREKELENLTTVEIYLVSQKEVRETARKLDPKNENVNFMDAFYFTKKETGEHYIYCADNFLDQDVVEILLRHELMHASKGGGYSRKAERILGKSYERPIRIKDERVNNYLKIPQERLVRKQALDHEMERLKIKKYGEKFTEEHFQKMMEAYKKDLFSLDAKIFIETTNPKYFKQIFDEIAKNEKNETEKV